MRKYLFTLAILLASSSAQAQIGGIEGIGGIGRSPRIYSDDGKYLGNINRNEYDTNSVANPYGRYGNPASPDSINNPYGRYGSENSPQGSRNPYGR